MRMAVHNLASWHTEITDVSAYTDALANVAADSFTICSHQEVTDLRPCYLLRQNRMLSHR
jgi:hypothetical protein